jgi:hypothetical protein
MNGQSVKAIIGHDGLLILCWRTPESGALLIGQAYGQLRPPQEAQAVQII